VRRARAASFFFCFVRRSDKIPTTVAAWQHARPAEVSQNSFVKAFDRWRCTVARRIGRTCVRVRVWVPHALRADGGGSGAATLVGA
jgi:hypothetical protein